MLVAAIVNSITILHSPRHFKFIFPKLKISQRNGVISGKADQTIWGGG